MAASYAVRASGVGSMHAEKIPGAFFDAIIEVTGDNSYPAQGYPFGVANLQTLFGGAYSAIESVDIVNNWTDNAVANGAKCFVANFDKAHNTVRGFSGGSANSTMVEVATGNAALNALVCSLRVRFY
jgi:hypothetical protein